MELYKAETEKQFFLFRPILFYVESAIFFIY